MAKKDEKAFEPPPFATNLIMLAMLNSLKNASVSNNFWSDFQSEKRVLEGKMLHEPVQTM